MWSFPSLKGEAWRRRRSGENVQSLMRAAENHSETSQTTREVLLSRAIGRCVGRWHVSYGGQNARTAINNFIRNDSAAFLAVTHQS